MLGDYDPKAMLEHMQGQLAESQHTTKRAEWRAECLSKSLDDLQKQERQARADSEHHRGLVKTRDCEIDTLRKLLLAVRAALPKEPVSGLVPYLPDDAVSSCYAILEILQSYGARRARELVEAEETKHGST